VRPNKCLIKGGGAALTREDHRRGQRALRLHRRPEQAGAGAGQVPAAGGSDPDGAQPGRRQIRDMTGGQPTWREGVVTDNGNQILDIHLQITDPEKLERELNQLPGVVCVGLFARRRADVVIVGGEPPVVL
jgi:ribose 5-phosphate isomerase A